MGVDFDGLARLAYTAVAMSVPAQQFYARSWYYFGRLGMAELRLT